MVIRPALVFLLVAALPLTAIPAALSAEVPCLSVSADEEASSHPLIASAILIPTLEGVDASESSETETFSGVLSVRGQVGGTVPVFHLRSTHARDAYRSRVPAVAHGRSPPLGE